MQTTKGCKALYPSGALSRLQLWFCLSHTAKLSFVNYRCTHISCICFGVLLALHIVCGKGVNCSQCTLLCSHTKMHCTCVVKSCTPGSVLAENSSCTSHKLFIGTAASISAPEYILPWLSYASPHSTCASRELGTPQRVKQKSIAQFLSYTCSLDNSFSSNLRSGKSVSNMHSPVLCILPIQIIITTSAR